MLSREPPKPRSSGSPELPPLRIMLILGTDCSTLAPSLAGSGWIDVLGLNCTELALPVGVPLTTTGFSSWLSPSSPVSANAQAQASDKGSKTQEGCLDMIFSYVICYNLTFTV